MRLKIVGTSSGRPKRIVQAAGALIVTPGKIPYPRLLPRARGEGVRCFLPSPAHGGGAGGRGSTLGEPRDGASPRGYDYGAPPAPVGILDRPWRAAVPPASVDRPGQKEPRRAPHDRQARPA